MVRTLETATGAFGTGVPQDPSGVMMTALEGQDEWQSEHAAVAMPHGVPVISHEGCRERVSTLHYVAILSCQSQWQTSNLLWALSHPVGFCAVLHCSPAWLL